MEPKYYQKGNFLKHNIVFVYGTLKSKNLNNWILHNAELLSNNAYTIQSYGFYDFGPYPFALENDYLTPNRIYGEVYKVDDKRIRINLDNLEGYPSLYYRKIIRINDTLNYKKSWSAWTYFLNSSQEYVDAMLLSGKILKNKSGKW